MKIKNWRKFQHFKDRKPPWIKLHREILEQRDINMISDCSFRVLVGIWLLASEDPAMEGNIPDVDDIAFRLRLEKSKVIKSLQELENFVEHDDINVISSRYQSDSLETETEEEKEAEKEEKAAPRKKPKKSHLQYPDWWGVDLQQEFKEHRKRKKAVLTQRIINKHTTEAEKCASVMTPGKAIEEVIDRGWQGFDAEWILNHNRGNRNGSKEPDATSCGFGEKDYSIGATDGVFADPNWGEDEPGTGEADGHDGGSSRKGPQGAEEAKSRKPSKSAGQAIAEMRNAAQV